ncbi:DUF2169 family type VI secretion system accessory protein [Polyangium sorediatum]|uniref:DUF2169 domain-containing protein n=1 Tax=Polyangium sorediatum TaxID=889274 RepID=A0ABT6P9I0_9BACT|nr:DUF2169 domain-containing protein [Polyangium sorediatum]MDI1437277.1 DUF2169 domain-containing protein [Polyangium sorediatum]
MDLERITSNRTPMVVRSLLMDDRHGREVLAVIAKLTYAAPRGVATIAVTQAPIRLEDEPTSSHPWASPKYPNDAVDHKPGTDILLVGTAYPPRGKPVTEFDVSLRVEAPHRSIHKVIRVYGPSVWCRGVRGVVPGPAATATPTPLVYEQAFGGRDETQPGGIVLDRRNPSGTGFAVDRTCLVGTPAPKLEDPRVPLSSRLPAPAGFGPLGASWTPRVERAGTFDSVWARERAPLRPVDFDPRYASVAPPDLWSEEPLEGTEAIEVLNATPDGVWRFRLPRYAPRFQSVIRGVERDLPTHLDTLLIDADAGHVELTWRATTPMPRKSEHVEAVRIFGAHPIPEPILADLLRRSLERDVPEAS